MRNTLVRLGQDVCQSPEEFKAWSQNLGHEKVLTTFVSYGAVGADRQSAILRGLALPRQNDGAGNADAIADALFARLRNAGIDLPRAQ